MYDNLVVNKPWGFEFMNYSNPHLAIWQLHLNGGERTSLHAHLHKKTGLVVLDGTAEVSFMNGSHILRAGDKIMIRNGVFHSTKAIDGDLELIEVETPNDKTDLVRLEDNYGRSGQPYESLDKCIEKQNCVFLKDSHRVGKCQLNIIKIDCQEDLLNRPDAKIVILEGRLYYQQWDVCAPGDIVDTVALTKLASKFPATPLTILEIKNAENL